MATDIVRRNGFVIQPCRLRTSTCFLFFFGSFFSDNIRACETFVMDRRRNLGNIRKQKSQPGKSPRHVTANNMSKQHRVTPFVRSISALANRPEKFPTIPARLRRVPRSAHAGIVYSKRRICVQYGFRESSAPAGGISAASPSRVPRRRPLSPSLRRNYCTAGQGAAVSISREGEQRRVPARTPRARSD